MAGRKRVESARTEARERAHSDGHHAITAGRHTSVSAGQSFLVSARQAVRLFAYKAGMKLIAAAGKVQVQAQKDGIEVSALKDIQIVSTEDCVYVTSPKKVVINGGGSFSEWSAGGINHGTQGAWTEHASAFDSPGPMTRPVVVPEFASGQLATTQRQVLVQYHDNEPVQGAAFRIDYADGRSYQGQLDAQGRADLTNAPDGPGKLYWGEDQRPFAPKPGDSNPQYVGQLTHEHLQASLNKARGKA